MISRIQIALVLVCIVGLAAAQETVSSQSVAEEEQVRGHQAQPDLRGDRRRWGESHLRATQVAEQLVVSVFDVQLQQLQENGMQDTELYQAIRAARANVGLVVNEEMAALARLLSAPVDTFDEQAVTPRQAQTQARRIAIKLLAERNLLRRRLRQPDTADRQAARVALEAMRQEQQQLHEQTREGSWNSQDRDRLAERQRELAAQLQEMQQTLGDLIQAGEQTLAAWDAAQQAERHLRSGEKPRALERQETVLRLLDEMARQLSNQPLDPAALAEQAMKLEQLGQTLDSLLEQQAAAKAAAADNPQQALDLESSIADSLQEADDTSDFGQAVESKLDQAQAAAQEAVDALQDGSTEAAEDRLQAVEAAEQSLLDAAAQVQSQLSGIQQSLDSSPPSDGVATVESTSKNQSSSGTTRDLGTASGSRADEEVAARGLAGEPWFTRLPEDLRNAILSNTLRPPPRGYEERLRRYFQQDDE